jgi:hypothetical protein
LHVNEGLKPIDIMVKQLQSVNENFIAALEVVNSVQEDIKSERETVTNEKTKKMVDDFLEGVKVTTTNGEQRRPRRNTAIPSRFNDFLVTENLPSENNKRPNIQIFIECLDLLNAEFMRRFSTENIALWEAMSALSPLSRVYLEYDILKPLFEYASTIPVLRDFYLKEKLSTKDLEAECRVYARVFKDKEWPRNKNEKIDLSEVAIIVINDYQKGAPILSSLYKVAVTSGYTSTRVECVFSSLTRIDSPQRRSMRTQREADLAYLSFESKVLMNDITFDDFYRAWKMKPRAL